MDNVTTNQTNEQTPHQVTEVDPITLLEKTPEQRLQDKIMMTRVIHARELFMTLSRDIRIHTAYLFLLVASRPGITVKELMKKAKLSQSSCSRNIALLSHTNRHKEPGFDLIEARTAPSDGRQRYMLYLTQEGEEFLALLKDIFR